MGGARSGFSVVTVVSSARGAGFRPPSCDGLRAELGPRLKVSRLHGPLTRHTPPNRVHYRGLTTPCVTDWPFASSCSPRLDYSTAVTFRFRLVDVCLTGTSTPLR